MWVVVHLAQKCNLKQTNPNFCKNEKICVLYVQKTMPCCCILLLYIFLLQSHVYPWVLVRLLLFILCKMKWNIFVNVVVT